jgi:hypothetical protein
MVSPFSGAAIGTLSAATGGGQQHHWEKMKFWKIKG